MILGRPFLSTIHIKIDVFNKEISLGIGDDRVTFDMNKKIYNFPTLVGKIYMVNSIHNNESSTSSNAPSDKSPPFEKSNIFHRENNDDDYMQERSSKKARILKPVTNTLSVHFYKPVMQNCNGIHHVWPTCDPTKKLCNRENEIYRMDKHGVLKNWYAEWCSENSSPDIPTSIFTSVQEDCKPRPRDYPFKEWLLTKVGHIDVSEPVNKALLKSCLIDCFWEELVKDPRSRNFDDYKWVFDLDINQLANEYKLGIRNKGHMLDEISEKCKKVQGDNTYWWHDHGLEDNERLESGLDIEEYNPPEVHVETFEVKRYIRLIVGIGQSFICVTKEIGDTLPLGRENGSRFREIIRKKLDTGRKARRKT
ncbi:hypothetical protein Tco_1340928 [Tanacetum coccineum]